MENNTGHGKLWEMTVKSLNFYNIYTNYYYKNCFFFKFFQVVMDLCNLWSWKISVGKDGTPRYLRHCRFLQVPSSLLHQGLVAGTASGLWNCPISAVLLVSWGVVFVVVFCWLTFQSKWCCVFIMADTEEETSEGLSFNFFLIFTKIYTTVHCSPVYCLHYIVFSCTIPLHFQF